MLKNLTQNQLLLIALATLLFLFAALSFFLLQDPNAPLPFAPSGSASTFTPMVVRHSDTPEPSPTTTPTPQTSYTPFATRVTATPSVATGTSLSFLTPTAPAGITASPGSVTITSTPRPSGPGTATPTTNPLSPTITPTPSTPTLSPTPSATLTHGEYEVTGRIIQNGTPVPNVVVWFEDDVAPRQSTTDSGGHYSFVTLAPGTHFILTFKQDDNHQLTPASQVTSLAWIEGTLPVGTDPFQLPDFEISLNLNGMIFEALTPVDGATYSAAYIGSSNPIQFIWALYGGTGSYHIEVGLNGTSTPVWTSHQIASTNAMWDGTLDNGSHITQGAYWWRVAVTTSLGPYVVDLYTQPVDILFNP